jgi:hypothetical protein
MLMEARYSSGGRVERQQLRYKCTIYKSDIIIQLEFLRAADEKCWSLCVGNLIHGGASHIPFAQRRHSFTSLSSRGEEFYVSPGEKRAARLHSSWAEKWILWYIYTTLVTHKYLMDCLLTNFYKIEPTGVVIPTHWMRLMQLILLSLNFLSLVWSVNIVMIFFQSIEFRVPLLFIFLWCEAFVSITKAKVYYVHPSTISQCPEFANTPHRKRKKGAQPKQTGKWN